MNTNLPIRSQQPLHLYRALLREATYLPDQTVRSWVREQIVHRFKKRRLLSNSNDTERSLQVAHKSLRKLQRANHGDYTPLQSIFHHAYGVTGPKRRKLLERLMRVSQEREKEKGDASSLFQDASSFLFTDRRFATCLEIQISRDGNGRVTRYECSISNRYPILKALVQSQARARIQTLRTFLRAPFFRPETENTWGKPMPRKRLKNLIKRWHSELLDKLTPPLPTEEFKRLGALASGELRWDGPRKRRPGILPNPQSAKPHELLAFLSRRELSQSEMKQDYMHPPPFPSSPSYHMAEIAGETSVKQGILEDAVGVERLNKTFKRDSSQITDSHRKLRRLWERIYIMSCAASWDREASQWVITWGQKRKTFATPAEIAFFDETKNPHNLPKPLTRPRVELPQNTLSI